MENSNKIGIVELIDRTLNKGVILNADLIITVADVPLLAANLRLALASVETMLKYGVMNDWLAPQYMGKRKDEKEEVMKLNPPQSCSVGEETK
ncbi:MAG: gas vesicle protein [Nanoarchaeota archaeon]